MVSLVELPLGIPGLGLATSLGGGALVMARLAGLCATAPLLSDPSLPRGVRFGFVAILGVALAPLRAADFAALDAALPSSLLPALAAEFAFGLCAGAAARFTLAAVEIAGQLAGISLGLGFAEQYDPQRGEPTVIGQRFARTAGALAFLHAGGLEALIRSAATPLASSASSADLAGAAAYALRMASAAAALGLGLAAPLLLAALLANLALALAHRAAVAINLFTVGLAVSLLTVGAAAVITAPQLSAGIQRLAQHAATELAEGSAP